MALNSSSRAQLTRQATEKSSSPLSKLKKALTDTTKSTEKIKKDKQPSMKNKGKIARFSWSSEREGHSSDSATSSSWSAAPVLASDPRFPPLASSYVTPPAVIDWRQPLPARSSTPGATAAATTTTDTPQFPPAPHPQAIAPATPAFYAYAPIQFPPRPANLPSPRQTAEAPPEQTNPTPGLTPSQTSGQTEQRAEASTSTNPDNTARVGNARTLFSALERQVERLLWDPSLSNYQQLGDLMKQINASGLDFTAIDASSLVLRILVDPGKENLDRLIAWIAKLGCPLVSGARKLALNRGSVLERAVERGWPKTVKAIAARLREDRRLREYTETMLARAMQSDRSLGLLEKALQFSSDHCPLDTGIAVRLVAILAQEWQVDRDNDLHGAKFIALFNEAVKQNLNTLPIATILQAATKFHHAPMALTMLQLGANTAYLDEDGKTVTDLALEAQQGLIEKIDALRAKEKSMDLASFEAEMNEYKKSLRSNQRILDALDGVTSPGTRKKTEFSE